MSEAQGHQSDGGSESAGGAATDAVTATTSSIKLQ